MEAHLGRRLSDWEVVHHRNGDRSDNCIKNLEIVTQAEHRMIHQGGNSERRRSITMRNRSSRRGPGPARVIAGHSFPRPFEDVYEDPLEVALSK